VLNPLKFHKGAWFLALSRERPPSDATSNELEEA
jgi:hypothetical protein